MARRKSTIGQNPLATATTEPADLTGEETIPHTEASQQDDTVTMAETVAAVEEPSPIAEPESETPEPSPIAEPERETAEPSPIIDTYAMQARHSRGRRIVRRYTGLSSATGLLLVPLPGVDVAGAVAVQLKMLHGMARLYGVAFNASLARQLIVALLSGGTVMLAFPVASAAKAVPVIGTLTGLLLSPTLSAASCYATGHAFLRHFEAGGTLETFDPNNYEAAA